MRAALFHESGGPHQLRIEEIDDPTIGAHEVLINVKACALNHIDLWVLSGHPAYPVSRPHVLGSDVSGIVERIGKDVGTIKEGQRVVVSPGMSCFKCQPCKGGHDNLCESYSILGAKLWGGMAEKVKVPAANVLPIPDNLSFETAAAFPLSYMTAWHMLTRSGLKKGADVLVVGASSGVGSAAIQISKYYGARVLATVTSDAKAELARSLGADAVINSSKESIAHMARAWTKKRGVDIAFEHVGPATWEQSIGSLAPGGVLVTCGATTGPEVKIDLRYLFSRELSILGNRMGTLADMTTLTQLVSTKKLTPRIAKTFSLDHASEALDMMEQRQHFGKIVILP